VSRDAATRQQHTVTLTLSGRYNLSGCTIWYSDLRMAGLDELITREEAVMRDTSRVGSFDLLQYSGGGCSGAVFLVRCKEATGNPYWK
jgi:hypothetical protein